MYENGAIIIEARTDAEGGRSKCRVVPYLSDGTTNVQLYYQERVNVFCGLVTELTGINFSNANGELLNNALNNEYMSKYDTKKEIPGMRITFNSDKIGVDASNKPLYEHSVYVVEKKYEFRVSFAGYHCPEFGYAVQNVMDFAHEDIAVEIATLFQTGKHRTYYYLS